MYKTSKILTTKRKRTPKMSVKADHKKHTRALKSLKSKVIRSIRYELKFVEGGVFRFEPPMLATGLAHAVEFVSDRHIKLSGHTYSRLIDQEKIETLIDILESLEE